MEKIYLSLYKQSLESLYKVLESQPNNIEARIKIAQLVLMNGNINEALKQCMLAYQSAPRNLACLSLLAHIFAHYGAKEEAVAFYNDILKIKENNVLTLFNLVTLDKQDATSPYLEKCKALLSKESELNTKDRSSLYFALAKIYDDLEDYDQSFEYLNKANELKRSILEFDIKAEKAFCDLLKNKYSEEFFADRVSAESDDHEHVPIFIVSLPRSGSSLVEQILASHSQVDAFGEIFLLQQLINDKFKEKELHYHSEAEKLNSEDYNAIAENYSKELKNFNPDLKKYTINKLPANFRYIGLIRLIFPQAKIINCKRNPIDLCLSCYKHNFANGQMFSFNLDEMIEYYEIYNSMLDHWHQVLPGYIFDLSYEDLINKQEAVSKALLKFCDLDWEESCLDFHKQKRHVKTASFDQVKTPLYQSSIEKWKKYEKHIEPLIKAFN